MHSRRLSTALFLVVFVLLTGFLADCGGDDQSGNRSQDGGSGGKKEQGDGAPKTKVSPPKIAIGTIARVKPEKNLLALRPTTAKQGEKPIRFRVNPENAEIKLDDKEVELAGIKRGQHAQVKYIVRNEQRNVAREVQVFEGGGATPGSGE
jgi:hypothetical protein